MHKWPDHNNNNTDPIKRRVRNTVTTSGPITMQVLSRQLVLPIWHHVIKKKKKRMAGVSPPPSTTMQSAQ